MTRLLLLVAMLLMPFGMADASAAAHQPMAAGMPMDHCPDQAPTHDSKGAIAGCSMACAAALPAADAPRNEPRLIATAPARPGVVPQFHGLHPDIATPPPKSS